MSDWSNPWLLPDGFEDVLPQRADRLESLRRRLLDLYQAHGYRLVMPPMLEYVDTLLAGRDPDLALQSFRLVDQASGRLLGLRADMTPQIARIDARRYQDQTPNRLCYADTVLRASADNYGGSRAALQVGAELFGLDSVEADAEIIALMLQSVLETGVREVLLDLGHVGIFAALLGQIDADAHEALFAAMRRKSTADIDAALSGLAVSTKQRDALLSLLTYCGDASVINKARQYFDAPAIIADLDALQSMHDRISASFPQVRVQVDLAELRGYRYHSGPIFSVYVAGAGAAIAQGGRYYGPDGKRPATGFSLDLKPLLVLQQGR